MRAARRQGVLEWFPLEQGLRHEWVFASPLFNISFAAVIYAAYTSFKADKDIMDILVHLRKKTGTGGRGEATACLRGKGLPESTTIFSVEAADQVYSQTNEFVYLRGNVNRNADLSVEIDRRIRKTWCSFRKYTL